MLVDHHREAEDVSLLVATGRDHRAGHQAPQILARGQHIAGGGAVVNAIGRQQLDRVVQLGFGGVHELIAAGIRPFARALEIAGPEVHRALALDHAVVERGVGQLAFGAASLRERADVDHLNPVVNRGKRIDSQVIIAHRNGRDKDFVALVESHGRLLSLLKKAPRRGLSRPVRAARNRLEPVSVHRLPPDGDGDAKFSIIINHVSHRRRAHDLDGLASKAVDRGVGKVVGYLLRQGGHVAQGR